jgi:uncharacterized membrane protein YfcA
MDVVLAMLLGLAGGAVGGLLGVGGGILFVPALTIFLGASQLVGEATSLAAIVPMALVGTWRQHRLGNVALRDGLTIGALSIPGVALGVGLANVLPERALQLGFAGLCLFVAARLLLKTLGPGPRQDSPLE